MPRRFLTIAINLVISILLVPTFWISYTEISKIIGLRAEPVEVAGTGSMYPSLFWDESQGGPEKSSTDGVLEYRSSPRMFRYFEGIDLNNRRYLKPTLGYGDMIAFSSAKTREILEKEGKNVNLGFIKRVIAKAGDQVELRDGYVLRNGAIIEEPYIKSARSTYGGSSLSECSQITVPPNSYFVLGDNRKVSSDSRFELSFVRDEDIKYYLPLERQSIYHSLWRDTKSDADLSGTSTLNPSDFYSKLSNLKSNKKLEASSRARASALLKNKDTTYNLEKSLSDAGYKNIVTGEFVIYGHYTADELWQNLQNNYETKAQLNNSDYDDIGISAVIKDVAGCPTQVIVGHLGGYIPATYESSMKESWESAKSNLADVIPSWEKAVGVVGVDQEKLNELLTLFRIKQQLIDEVLRVINNREWMSDELKTRLKQDETNSKRASELAKELSGE
jgi:signal peptidase I